MNVLLPDRVEVVVCALHSVGLLWAHREGLVRGPGRLHAAAQCREWIATHLGGVDIVPEASNAAAAQGVAQGHYDAAIAPAVAAEVYGLDVIATDVGDNDEAWTRFVLVARPGSLPEPTGADKTTLYLFMRANHPGALLEILTEFSVRGVDLTRIESRPTRRALDPGEIDPGSSHVRPGVRSVTTSSPSTAKDTSATPASVRR